MTVLPQFPLGSVLFPGMVLPLHVFELRYRKLIVDVLAQNGEFGVVLIERGSTVGGGDVRTNFGTTAKIVKADKFVDGRWNIVTVGSQRFEVVDWLEDDPYPQADVTMVEPDVVIAETESCAKPVCDELADDVNVKFRRLMAIAAEAGLNVGTTQLELADASLSTFQMAACAPLATIDKHRVLSELSAASRLELLANYFDDAISLLRLQICARPYDE